MNNEAKKDAMHILEEMFEFGYNLSDIQAAFNDAIKAGMTASEIDDRLCEPAFIYVAKQRYVNYKEVVDFLLDNDFNINRQYYNGCTALMEAASLGNIDILSYLLERGADPLIKMEDGKQAIDFAEDIKCQNISLLFWKTIN